MSAASLVGVKGAPLSSKPATEFSRVHRVNSWTTLMLSSRMSASPVVRTGPIRSIHCAGIEQPLDAGFFQPQLFKNFPAVLAEQRRRP